MLRERRKRNLTAGGKVREAEGSSVFINESYVCRAR